MFQLSNAYGMSAGERGFDWPDNPDFIREWSGYYTGVLYSKPALQVFHSNSNDPAGGYIGNNLFKWAWSLIYDKLPEEDGVRNHKIYLNFIARTFSNDSTEDRNYMLQRDQINENIGRFGREPISRHDVEVVYIKKGLKAFDYFMNEHKDKEIPSISTLLTFDRFQKIAVFRGRTGKISIVTTKFEPSLWFKIFGLLPAFFDDIKQVVDHDTTIYGILKSFFDNDPSLLVPLLQKAIANYADEAYRQTLEQFYGQLESIKNSDMRRTQARVDELRMKLQNAENSLASILSEKASTERMLTSMLLNPQEIDPNLRKFLDGNKHIKIRSVTNNNKNIRVEFKTPIMTWSKQDAESFFRNPDRETLWNRPEWLAEIAKKIFIDEEYRVLLTTVVDIPIVNTGDNYWKTQAEVAGTYGNPHFVRYECYDSSQTQYIKAIMRNDYVQGLCILLAATASINFADSSVMRHMSGDFKPGGKAYNLQILQNVETGMICSIDELRTFLERKKAESAVRFEETVPAE